MDSNRFGFKIAKVNNFEDSPDNLVKELKGIGVKMIICKIACENLALINKLEQLNFNIMDFQVTYRYDLLKYVYNTLIDSDIIIRIAKSTDKKALKIIALESFYQYGHYFADKRLDQAKCNEIYKDWVSRSIENPEVADIVFVAEKAKELAGFLSFKIIKNESSSAVGVQGAVSKKFRNQNVFKLLAMQGLKWGSELKLSWEEHNVLLTNYPVNRSFLSIGFVPYKSFITMHGWLD